MSLNGNRSWVEAVGLVDPEEPVPPRRPLRKGWVALAAVSLVAMVVLLQVAGRPAHEWARVALLAVAAVAGVLGLGSAIKGAGLTWRGRARSAGENTLDDLLASETDVDR